MQAAAIGREHLQLIGSKGGAILIEDARTAQSDVRAMRQDNLAGAWHWETASVPVATSALLVLIMVLYIPESPHFQKVHSLEVRPRAARTGWPFGELSLPSRSHK